ncbi:MAG: GDP/GTP exchange factor for ARF [Vezdaea aestivalis]|nr:MAG: GDP/GTP exchange factor for ARF [Vezdaea aestivalis]
MTVSVDVDPVALITTECVTVTSAMRKHAKWAHSSVSAILSGSATSSEDSLYSSWPYSPKIGAPKKNGKEPHTNHISEDHQIQPTLANRWGLRGKKGKSMQDNPLMSAFAILRRDLFGCNDIRMFDTPALLHPFLQVIRSSSTSAPITSLALVAITKFFAYNLISQESPRLPLAMQLLSSAITHCRFEASDSAADEIVLLRILKLMEGMLSGPGGDLLSDESVCEMMETGLSMCCQVRLSELLRRSAEMSMVSMCQIIFERLKQLEAHATGELQRLEDTTNENSSAMKMNPTVNGNNITSPQQTNQETPEIVGGDAVSPASDANQREPQESETGSVVPENNQRSESIRPYSLPSIRELFRVLVFLLDPHDNQHTDAMRVMALRIIDVALEVAGPSITKHPSLSNLAKDQLCRYLLQLVRSDNMAILQESLRVTGTLMATCREMLKLQQELFLSYLVACLHPRVEIPREVGIDPSLYEGVFQTPNVVRKPPSQANSGRSTPVPVKDRQRLGLEGGSRKPDAREAMVESVGALARIPTFMAELYINYDCETDQMDLCADMVGLLSRNAFPDSATWSTTNVPPLCLDALLSHVTFVFDRLDKLPSAADVNKRELLRDQKSRKKIITTGTTKFNEKPKAGIAYLSAQGAIEDPSDPQCLASFLKGTTRISKKVLGDYLSKQENERVLTAFMESFDFSSKRVDEALRELLETFRLPGESQLIERIITVFSEKYCARSTPEEVADKDAVYILTYAIIMLNTDQHNPNIKSQPRMSAEDFARNLRGTNNGKDFAPTYLQDIFNSIKEHEIILPDEHDNKHAFNYAWKELLLKARGASDMTMCKSNAFDSDMFSATWKPVIATLSFVFLSASDEAVFTRVVTGFNQCASIAAAYGLTEALDHIIYCLSSISTLAIAARPNTALNTEVQVEGHRVMVSELAVKLGRDFKAQLATVVLFRIITGNENSIRKGWAHIVRIWLNLFANSLVPPYFETPAFKVGIPPIPLESPAQVIERSQKQSETGIFQAFTSYLSSYATDEPPEPSEEELESTLCTVDCINSCYLGDLFKNISQMSTSSLSALISTLLEQLPEESAPTVIVVKPDQQDSLAAPGASNGQVTKVRGPKYDPIIVYILELATTLALRDEDTIQGLAQSIGESLQSTIRSASKHHPVVVGRTTFYLLSLLHASQDHSLIRAPVVLHSISSIKVLMSDSCAGPLVSGLQLCVKQPGPLRREMISSPDFWSILRLLGGSKAADSKVFDILEDIVAGTPPAVSADNYIPIVDLLSRFASSAKVKGPSEQRLEGQTRRGKPLKKSQPTRSATEKDLIQRGSKAVILISQLTGRIQGLIEQSHLETTEAWTTYWSPIFGALSHQCLNPCREIRQQAVSSLQRSLLSPELTSTDHNEWTSIFGEVLFPLIVELLKPEIFQSDPVGMSETRVQAATLLCKVFLHYLVLLSEWGGMLDLWLRILDIMDRLMNSGQGDNLEEAVPESLKNVILVMSSGDLLSPPPQSKEKEVLWIETCKRLDRFLPDLMMELFPKTEASGKAPSAAEISSA